MSTTAAAALDRAVQPPSVFVLLAFVGLVAITESLQVRYLHHDDVDALNLMEGVLAPLIFVGSALDVALAVVAGTLLAAVVRHNAPVKAVFNAAMWASAAAAGELVFHAAAPQDVSSAAGMAALALGVVVMSVVNVVLIAGVLRLVAGSWIGSRDRRDARGVVLGHVVDHAGSLTAGVALTAAYRWTPWLLVIAVVMLVGMHAAGKANAAVRADRRRLEGLQRATHVLATSLDAADAVPAFLAEARAGFEVRAVELVLCGPVATVHVATAAAYRCERREHRVAEHVVGRGPHPTRFSVTDAMPEPVRAAMAAAGHQRAIGVPLVGTEGPIGALLLYDRFGMEGFEQGELAIAAALGRELVGFLERVELVHEIDGERRKLADILESTSDGILSMDATGVITSWNTGLASITGRSAEEMIGTRHIGLLRARDAAGRDVHVDGWAPLLDAGGVLPAELQIVSAAGDTVWLSCSYSRIPASEGRPDVLVAVARNITQARELEKLKDDFVAVVSHELRTPLVPIKGWAQTLLTRGDRLSAEQQQSAVQSILSQAQKLEALVLNILEASRIESGRVDSDGTADVAAVTLRVVEEALAARPDRLVRVRPPAVPCPVKGSTVWVERAVTNLVGNAVKYSPDDEPIDVDVTVDRGTVTVAVTDRGPGIAPDAQQRIFERFERLEESRTQTGTGLGLYITRRLARAMGGEVSVSSVPGAGSTFLLRLPLAPDVAAARMPRQVPPRERADEATLLELPR